MSLDQKNSAVTLTTFCLLNTGSLAFFFAFNTVHSVHTVSEFGSKKSQAGGVVAVVATSQRGVRFPDLGRPWVNFFLSYC
jgi:hypothetical protein